MRWLKISVVAAFILLTSTLLFAGAKVFTDDDLDRYSYKSDSRQHQEAVQSRQVRSYYQTQKDYEASVNEADRDARIQQESADLQARERRQSAQERINRLEGERKRDREERRLGRHAPTRGFEAERRSDRAYDRNIELQEAYRNAQ